VFSIPVGTKKISLQPKKIKDPAFISGDSRLRCEFNVLCVPLTVCH